MTRRPLPAVTLALALATPAAFRLELVAGVQPYCLAHGFNPAHPSLGSALASLVLHASWVHLLGNLAVLLAAGPLVERAVGRVRFLFLYVSAGLAGAALHAVIGSGTLVGCSASLCALLACASTLRPRAWLAFTATFVSFNLCQVVTGGGGSVSVAAHTAGFVAGALFAVVAWARGSLPPRALA